MAGTSEGGKKAAAHQDMSEKGRKGAEALNADSEKKSAAAKKAAETRGHESLSAAGKKGGEHSHGGKSKDED